MYPILNLVITFLVAALVIWIVGRLKLGIEVDGYVPALIAAIVIAIVSWLVIWLLSFFPSFGTTGGWFGALINLIVAAVVILISGRFVPGLRVKGFVGAIVAAISIGVVTWLLKWVRDCSTLAQPSPYLVVCLSTVLLAD